MLGAKFKWNGNGVRGEIADPRNVDTVAIWETLHLQPKELQEGQLIDVNEEKWLRLKEG